MSFSGAVEEQFNKLTEAQQSSIFELIVLFNQKNEGNGKKIRNFPFDMFKDGNEFMSDDFDEIPEGFEEYI